LIKGTPARKPGSQSHRSKAFIGHDSGVANTRRSGALNSRQAPESVGTQARCDCDTGAASQIGVTTLGAQMVSMGSVRALREGVVRWLACVPLCLLAIGAPLLSGCSPAGILLSAAGVATDTSVSWEIVKHLHAKMTEGDDVACYNLNSVQRALNVRCGAFSPGSLVAADIRHSGLQSCPLAIAVRDPKFWPTLPEFIEKGATFESCAESPIVELAQIRTCPDFTAASSAELKSIRDLAVADPRAVHHDVVRMLSCPNARMAGLDTVLGTWMARGDFDIGKVSFGPLGALHPEYLDTPLANALEAQGHTAREGLGGYEGVQPRGFEVALRTSNFAALDWWLSRAPELADRVPPSQGGSLPWVPLAKVVLPKFLADASQQTETVEFLMAHGANPWQKLPYDSSVSVVEFARAMKSPMLAVLDRPATQQPRPTLVARMISAE
jgi:hypothetical protein